MGRLGILAKTRQKHSGIRPAWRLTIDGDDYTSSVENMSGGHEEEGGGSSFTFEITDPYLDLNELQDAMCHLYLGYGDTLAPYLSGRLQEPYTPPFGGLPKGRAYGPFMEMGNNHMRRDHDYTGDSVEDMMIDLGIRAQMGPRTLQVFGGSDVIVRQGRQTAETTLLEAAKSGTDSLGYVMNDMPLYRRRVMPFPTPGGSDPVAAEYTESDYEEDAFSVTPTQAVRFSSVIVFRRAENGTYRVWEEAEVANRTRFLVPRNRIMFVPEFAGNSAQALNEATRRANALAKQSYGFTLNVPINPELLPYTTVNVSRTERVGKRTVVATYSCLIERIGFDVKLDAFDATYEGTATRISEVFVPVKRHRSVVSTGIVGKVA